MDELKDKTSLRIGLSGPPGAGKSTLIEALGQYVTLECDRKLAVLAVDPSSSRTGGSLLGDKTRMPELAKNRRAFIRASPSSGHLGGVAQATSDAILVCEAAGYDLVIVETVGVGQSEQAVADMTDVFVLLLPPGGGDELQGLKRGILEKVHFVVVTKADGHLLPAARRMQYEYISASKYLRPVSPHWKTKVLSVSAHENSGIAELFAALTDFHDVMLRCGEFYSRRKEQKERWMWNFVTQSLMDVFQHDPDVLKILPSVKAAVVQGTLTPHHAADVLLSVFRSK